MSTKLWDEITYPFPNFISCSVEIWKRISDFITHFVMNVIVIHAGKLKSTSIAEIKNVYLTMTSDEFLC